MKAAVYAIAKDEEQFVRRWYDSVADADFILLVDTGSTDGTRQVAAACPGVTVRRIHVDPWRFDDARNAALAMIPEDMDYCVTLDLDETLSPGWREHLETALATGTTRVSYHYVWSWTDQGAPAIQFAGDRIHARAGYRWRNACHETVGPTLETAEVRSHFPGLRIEHHPDPTKSRRSYLGLLWTAVREDPEDDRLAFYYARELKTHGMTEASLMEFKRHLALPRAVWRAERAASMRYIAAQTEDLVEAEGWLLKACAEEPGEREGWLALAEHYLGWGRLEEARGAAVRGLAVTERRLHYISDPRAWDGALEAVLAAALDLGVPPGGR